MAFHRRRLQTRWRRARDGSSPQHDLTPASDITAAVPTQDDAEPPAPGDIVLATARRPPVTDVTLGRADDSDGLDTKTHFQRSPQSEADRRALGMILYELRTGTSTTEIRKRFAYLSGDEASAQTARQVVTELDARLPREDDKDVRDTIRALLSPPTQWAPRQHSGALPRRPPLRALAAGTRTADHAQRRREHTKSVPPDVEPPGATAPDVSPGRPLISPSRRERAAPIARLLLLTIAGAAVAFGASYLVWADGALPTTPAVTLAVAGARLDVPAAWTKHAPTRADRRRGLTTAMYSPAATLLMGELSPGAARSATQRQRTIAVRVPGGPGTRIDDSQALRAVRAYLFSEQSRYVVVACRRGPAAIRAATLRACDSVVSTLRFTRTPTAPRPPSAITRRNLEEAFAGYQRASRAARATLLRAVLRKTVAASARYAARAASAAVNRVPGSATSSLRAAFRDAARGWIAAASAALQGDAKAFSEAGQAVNEAERHIDAQRASLAALGYRR